MSAPAKLDGRRILIVEDEYFIAQELALAFESAGARVLGPVADIAGALRLLDEAGDFDGAVLDINLQGELAYPLADALLQRELPFVFATGYDQRNIPAAYAGIRRCEKPVEPGCVVEFLFGGA